MAIIYKEASVILYVSNLLIINVINLVLYL